LHREWVAAANASSEAYGRELPPQIAVVEEAAMEIQANLGAIKEGAQNGCISEADVTALLGWDLQAISAVEGSVTEALAFVLACACAHSVGAARRVSQAAAQQRDKVVSDLKKGAGDATLRPALRLLEAMGGSLAPTIRVGTGLMPGWGTRDLVLSCLVFVCWRGYTKHRPAALDSCQERDQQQTMTM
jgi:hypothetical protein